MEEIHWLAPAGLCRHFLVWQRSAGVAYRTGAALGAAARRTSQEGCHLCLDPGGGVVLLALPSGLPESVWAYILEYHFRQATRLWALCGKVHRKHLCAIRRGRHS